MIQKIDFAPMEGITGFVFRNAFHQVFSGVGRYYTPFLSPGPDLGIPKRDRRDIFPENNRDVPLVPQILTNRAEDFLKTAELLYDFGYREVNLNLGCPSGTVVAKKKGAGFLSEPVHLRNFLDDVFYGASRMMPDLRISVKTRIGVNSPEEFPALLSLFLQYPLSELIIHPRVRKEQYKGLVHMDAFAYAAREFEMKAAGNGFSTSLTYNGDIVDTADILRTGSSFPAVARVMCGRGLLRNPCLAEEYFADMPAGPGGKAQAGDGGQPGDPAAPEIRKEESGSKGRKIRRFHELLVEGYREAYPENPGIITARLKELWFYLGDSFPGTDREQKALKKARTPEELIRAAERILEGSTS